MVEPTQPPAAPAPAEPQADKPAPAVLTPDKPLPPITEPSAVQKYRPQIMFWLILLVLGGIVVAVFFNLPVIKSLSDTGFARGLITFIITVATIGLAFVLVFQSFSESSEDSFRRAREVFAGLMGVLGTIVGFYFGSAEKPSALLEIATLKAAEKQLVTYVSGGVRPYQYSITSTDKDFKVIDGSSEDGWIVVFPEQAPKAGSKVTVTVTDSKQQKESRSIDFPAGMGLQASPPASKPSG